MPPEQTRNSVILCHQLLHIPREMRVSSESPLRIKGVSFHDTPIPLISSSTWPNITGLRSPFPRHNIWPNGRAVNGQLIYINNSVTMFIRSEITYN